MVYATTYFERGSSVSGWSYDLSFDLWSTRKEAEAWAILLEHETAPEGYSLYRICTIETLTPAEALRLVRSSI